MFYIKRRQPCGKTIPIEITDENVFTRCPECGRELPVDLAELFADGEGDLCAASVLCSRCTAKRAEAAGRGPRTYEGIERLTRLLLRAGYVTRLLGLYERFNIEDLAELSPMEYAEFGAELAKLVRGEG